MNDRSRQRIYIASSWRNERYLAIIQSLRIVGHSVYDWRNPTPDNHGFHWSEIEPGYQIGEKVATETFVSMLAHPLAEIGFKNDSAGMEWATVGVLLLPCGASAHAEAGWLRGGTAVFVLIEDEQVQPELMYRIFNGVFTNIYALIGALAELP